MARRERRTSPRLEVSDQLHARIVAFPVRLTVRDLGPGGFCIEGPLPFVPGGQHLFRFTTAAGEQVLIEATVTYSRSAGDLVVPRYVTGFSFVHRSAETTAGIDVLLDAMMAGLEFEEDPYCSAAEAAASYAP